MLEGEGGDDLAPVVLFVYNRLEHTVKTIEALKANDLAHLTELYIYCDGPKNKSVLKGINQVRSYVAKVDGFLKVNVIYREENLGLSKSIVSGVTEVVNTHGKVIVLEDDVVASKKFLSFMNEALKKYKDNPKVWHVSGWNYPIDARGLGDVFFWKIMNCWGWGTWKESWGMFEKEPEILIKRMTNKEIKEFDFDNSGIFWNQVLRNEKGVIDTWAIFWYATIYKHQGLCLNPASSYIENIGLDGTGTNCGKSNPQYVTRLSEEDIQFPDEVFESKHAKRQVKKYLYKSKKIVFKRVVNEFFYRFGSRYRV